MDFSFSAEMGKKRTAAYMPVRSSRAGGGSGRRKDSGGPRFYTLLFHALFIFVISAERGRVHHADTQDYCLQAGDITVGMSGFQGLNESRKQALAEGPSPQLYRSTVRCL